MNSFLIWLGSMDKSTGVVRRENMSLAEVKFAESIWKDAIDYTKTKTIIKDETTNWETTKGGNEVPCHTKIVGGVLCRWWGDGPIPSGVELLNACTRYNPNNG